MQAMYDYRREPIRSRVLGREVHFGIYRPRNAAGIRETFYLLHGSNGDDQQFHQAAAIDGLPSRVLEALVSRQAQVILPFIAGSCLHAHPERPEGDFSKYFFEEVMPAAESGTQTEASTRFIAGLSMGGQAALNAFFRFPRLFAGAGAHFATLLTFDPWDDASSSGYQKRMGVADGWMSVLLNDLRSEFTGSADFGSHDPIRLAAAVAAEDVRGKPIYFDVGTLDAFGLQEGSEALSALLTQRGIPHQFHLVEGGAHDAGFIHARFQHLMAALLSGGGSTLSPSAGGPPRREAGERGARA